MDKGADTGKRSPSLDARCLADQHDRVRDLVDRIHRIGGWIALGAFSGYAVAGWLLWQGRVWQAAGVATVAFLVFRRFRSFALGLARHWAGVHAEYAQAMAFIEEAVRRMGERRALMEIDARLHRPPRTRNR